MDGHSWKIIDVDYLTLFQILCWLTGWSRLAAPPLGSGSSLHSPEVSPENIINVFNVEMNIIICSHLQLLSSFCWAKVLKFIKRYALFVDFCWYLRDWQEAVLVIFSVMFAGWEGDPGWQGPSSWPGVTDGHGWLFPRFPGPGPVLCCEAAETRPGRGRGCLTTGGLANQRPVQGLEDQSEQWAVLPCTASSRDLVRIVHHHQFTVMSHCHTLLGLKLAQSESSNEKTLYLSPAY